MRKFKSYNSRYWHSLLARTGLIIGIVAIIVWVLPRKEELRFHYDMGKPWMYNSFIAKFDFPIYKTDEAIKAEQDSMLAVFQPYYNCDPTVERKQIRYSRTVQRLSDSHCRQTAQALSSRHYGHTRLQSHHQRLDKYGACGQREASSERANQLHLLHDGGL